MFHYFLFSILGLENKQNTIFLISFNFIFVQTI